jgi:site-specific DNA recombinase
MKQHGKIRCAIYTRKSHEEGLEQEYNSLDAQRDSAINYINSQRHEGWVGLPERYDDGGFSGGNMERPAIKRLFTDIEKGLIDVVVVYKIDRLSRSIADFVRMMEFFEKHSVVFRHAELQHSEFDGQADAQHSSFLRAVRA